MTKALRPSIYFLMSVNPVMIYMLVASDISPIILSLQAGLIQCLAAVDL